jgi:PAS domain S-box-containing protein
MDDVCISVWEKKSSKLIYLNPTGCQLFGFDSMAEMEKAFTSGNCFTLITPDSQNPLSLGKSEGHWKDEMLFRRKNGTTFHGFMHTSMFRHAGTDYLLRRVIDIEELNAAVVGLQEEKTRFEALFEYATMGILLMNKDGEVILANHFAGNLFGYMGNEMQGRRIEDFIPERFRKKHVGQRQGYIAHPQSRAMGQGLGLFALRKDGSEFPVEISLGHYRGGDEPFAIAFIIDITRRKEIEDAILSQQEEMARINQEIEHLNDELEKKVDSRTRQLKQTLEELRESRDELESALSKEKELSDLKTRFVSMASHEFRTPLSTILSSASLVAKYTQTEEQDKRDKHIQRIRSTVSNLTDILNEFLSIGRIEEGRVQTNLSAFNIKEQVQMVCNEMKPILRKGQSIRFSHEGSTQATLDLSLVRNVIINLVSNAIKFSPENGSIDVKTEVNEKQILISVRDYGIGIPEEDKKHLFERFFRATNVTNIQGTGLGLHIVSKYVELMNGRMEVESELEKGTQFKITFQL